MESKIKNFRELRTWQVGTDLLVDIYKITKSYPKSEIFGMTNQMRRASLSISSNIAEGFVRYHNNEHRQFLYIALGSCAELETQIEASHRLGYISEDIYQELIQKITYETRMIRNSIKRFT